MRDKIIRFGFFVILIILLVGCIKEEMTNEIKPEYPEDFNLIYEYEFDKKINLKENKYIVSGCYPRTEFYMPFSVEEKNEFYKEIIKQNLLNFSRPHKFFKEGFLRKREGVTCYLVSPPQGLFEFVINLNNKSNKFSWEKGSCFFNKTLISDASILKTINQIENLENFSDKIESIIDSKIIELNISLPEPKPDCGYI